MLTSRLNPLVKVEAHKKRLTPDNALEIFASYDFILDCTDNPASRYLISDTCVLLGKPLVSASALRTDGQLVVLNYPARPSGDPGGGPCYRCIFPKPPPAETVVSCGDGGILGPVVGVMGVLQALEAIKLITSGNAPHDSQINVDAAASAFAEVALDPPSLLLFSAYTSPQFRSMRLRPRRKNCASCSAEATVSAEALTSGSMDYVEFCGVANPVNLLSPEERVSAAQYAEARKSISLSGRKHQVVDVREKVQFDLCHLYGSINIPFSLITSVRGQEHEIDNEGYSALRQLRSSLEMSSGDPVYVVCRLGNDSQVAVKKLKELGFDANGRNWIGDVRGGLKAWREKVDPSFPDY
jgi:adenylyltransferase/sulfurtransferase